MNGLALKHRRSPAVIDSHFMASDEMFASMAFSTRVCNDAEPHKYRFLRHPAKVQTNKDAHRIRLQCCKNRSHEKA